MEAAEFLPLPTILRSRFWHIKALSIWSIGRFGLVPKATPRELAESLSGKHSELVRFLRMRLPSEDDARDLAQEAFLRLIRLSDDHFLQHPEAYLFRIASNLVYEYWLRSKPGITDPDTEPENLPSRQPTPETLVGQQQALGELQRVIDVLPPIQREVVLAHRRDGKTYAEIALDLEISRDMVKKHLGKALARCRQCLILAKHES